MNIPEGAVLHILVLDFDTLACEETSASEFSRTGCRIQSTRHKEIGKTLGLRIAGYEQMVKARISGIGAGDIAVHYEFADSETSEKRSERRRKVSIPAFVSGKTSQEGVSCEIIDASPSGCRLSSLKLQGLPADIQLQIPGLDLPVNGKIVWRAEGLAGVKLLWQFARGARKGQERIRPPGLAEKAGAKSQRKADSSGFGVRRNRDAG
jgi:hypothetical protein